MSNRSTASFHIELAGYHMSFRIMPAWICKQCGETYFETYSEEHEVNIIQSASIAGTGRIGGYWHAPDSSGQHPYIRSEIYATGTACIH